MKIVRQSESELVLQNGTLWISVLLALGSVPLFATTPLAGAGPNTIAGVIFLIGALVWLRKSTVVFDAVQRNVRWKCIRFFRSASGVVPFSEITGIVTETSPGSGGTTHYRLALLTAKRPLPLSDSYSGDRENWATARKAIQHFLQERGFTVPSLAAPAGVRRLPDPSSSVRSLLLQGRTMDAIRLFETTQNVDLPTATRRVNEIAASLRAKPQH